MARGGVVVLMGLSLACARLAPAPAPRHSEAMERSARLLRQLDKLEADLHQNDAEMLTYSVLVARHGRAEQVACRVSDEHVQEIHRLAVAQEEKIQQKKQERRKRRAVAHVSHSGRTLAAR